MKKKIMVLTLSLVTITLLLVVCSRENPMNPTETVVIETIIEKDSPLKFSNSRTKAFDDGIGHHAFVYNNSDSNYYCYPVLEIYSLDSLGQPDYNSYNVKVKGFLSTEVFNWYGNAVDTLSYVPPRTTVQSINWVYINWDLFTESIRAQWYFVSDKGQVSGKRMRVFHRLREISF